MQDTQAFAPFYRVTVPSSQTGQLMPSTTIAATSAAAETSAFPGVSSQLQVTNTSTTAIAYIQLGVAGAVVTATSATGYPILPLQAKTISIAPEVTAANVLASAGPINVIFTRGNGV